MGETETGRYKIDDKPSSRVNRTRRDIMVRNNFRCRLCGHTKAFKKKGKLVCCSCGGVN